jgi:polyhydroxyalkanoate synthesis regulator phasin
MAQGSSRSRSTSKAKPTRAKSSAGRSTAAKSSSGRSTAAKSSSGRSASAKSSSGRSASAKSSSGRSSAAKSSSGRSSAAKSSSGRSAASRKAAASKGGKTTARKRTARKAASSTANTAASAARGAGVEAKTVAELRDALRKNLINPLEMVLISRDRIEEVLGEAVDQGRVTVRDAQRITSGLVKRGQRQTSDVLKDLENLLDRGRSGIEGRASGARGRAVRRASPALAQVDRVRRTAGVGPNFPVTGYDDLTATQVQARLSTLTPAELRKVRDHERRNASRKTVLQAIESKLG